MIREDKLVRDWFERHRPLNGERLPPERALADALGLSRAALRKGLAALEEKGLLLRQVGRGTFVQDEVRPAREDRVEGADDVSPRQLLGARLVIEPSLARMAAREGSRSHFTAIEEAEAKVTNAASADAFDAADDAFHRAIAEAGGNAILLRCLDATLAAGRRVGWGALRPPRGPETETGRAAIMGHAAILAAVLARNVQAAGDTMTRHLTDEMGSLVLELV